MWIVHNKVLVFLQIFIVYQKNWEMENAKITIMDNFVTLILEIVFYRMKVQEKIVVSVGLIS